MNVRKILIIVVILATLSIPFIELTIGFYYVNSVTLCPMQNDIMLLMSIGGVFGAIAFASAFAFVSSLTPAKFKNTKELTAAQISAKGSSRAMQILIGCITFIFSTCAMIYFILLQVRIYRMIGKVQWTNSTRTDTYCLFTIYSSALGLIITLYVGILIFLSVALIMLFGIGL